MATMRTTMDGPASRNNHFGPNPQEEASGDEDDINNGGDGGGETGMTGACPSRAQPPADATNALSDSTDGHEALRYAELNESNEFETITGVDTSSDLPEVALYNTLQTKLQLLKHEAQKTVQANEAGTDMSKISASTAAAGAQEQFRRIAVNLQDVARKLAKKQPF